MMWKSVLCVLAAATVCARGQQVDSGSGLVRTALERNRELQALRRRVDEARAQLRQAGVRPAPAIEAVVATGRPLGTRGEEEYSAGLVYPVETAGKRARRMEIARLSVSLAEAEYLERARQLGYEVKTVLTAALAERQRLSALERILESARDSLKLTEARVTEGDAAPLERDLLLVDVNRTEAQRTSAAGRADAAVLELAALTGVDSAGVPVARGWPPPARDFAIEGLRTRALDGRPDLRTARLLEERAGAEVRLSEAQARPDLTLSARYSQSNARFDQYGLDLNGRPEALRDRDNTISFGVSVPLLRKRLSFGAIEAASARAVAARLRREHLERTIPLEVEAAWRRWEAAHRAAELLDSGVRGQSERNLEVVRQAYALGQLRMLDVLNEQRRVLDIEMAGIDAAAEAARAWAELERAVGGELQ